MTAPPTPPAASKSPTSPPPSFGQWPLVVVVAGIVVGLVIVAAGQWRLGCVVIGTSLAIGAVERIALPRREAGLLQVRGKIFDVVIMLATGAGIIALAILVPEGRSG